MNRETQRQIEELPTEFAPLLNHIIRYQVYWDEEAGKEIDIITRRMHATIDKMDNEKVRARLHVLLERWLHSTHSAFALIGWAIDKTNDDESTKT